MVYSFPSLEIQKTIQLLHLLAEGIQMYIAKKFAVTLKYTVYYSPKAYDYVRSVQPLSPPSLIRKWSIHRLWRNVNKKANIFLTKANTLYVGLVNYEETPPENPDTPASEAVVILLFLLVFSCQ